MSGASGEGKRRLLAAVDRLAPFWREMALRIHAHPEPGLDEAQAAAWLGEALERAGFALTRGVADLPTSFVATRRGGAGPVIAFVAEYDALANVGHACGHNLIAAAAGLAGQALAEAAPAAEVRVVGAPDEERYGGKVQMVERGVFADVDFAMMAHGGFMNLPSRDMLGRQLIVLEFRGRSTSVANAPQLGVNALDALVLAYSGAALMRQHVRSTARVSAIITHGGTLPGTVPDYARGEFLLRAREPDYPAELERRLLDCARGAAQATGATLELSSPVCTMLPMRRNAALEAAYERSLRYLGEEVGQWPADAPIGSTDFGNVSHVVPGIHAYFRMVPREVKHHTPEFAEASRSEAGLAGMVSAAKAMALTGLDLAEDADLRAQVQADFRKACEPTAQTL